MEGVWAYMIAVAVLITTGAVFVCPYLLVRGRIERNRTKAIRQASLGLGMTFLADDESLAKETFFQFPLFQRVGYSKKAKNVLRGSSGDKEVVLFGYEYTASGYDYYWTHRQTVAAFRFRTDIADFIMNPDIIRRWIDPRSGMRDFSFKSHPEFSGNYRLLGKQEAAIRGLFSPEVLQFFSQRAGWSLEAGGRWLVIYRRSKRVAPRDLAAFLQQTTRIAHLFG